MSSVWQGKTSFPWLVRTILNLQVDKIFTKFVTTHIFLVNVIYKLFNHVVLPGVSVEAVEPRGQGPREDSEASAPLLQVHRVHRDLRSVQTVWEPRLHCSLWSGQERRQEQAGEILIDDDDDLENHNIDISGCKTRWFCSQGSYEVEWRNFNHSYKERSGRTLPQNILMISNMVTLLGPEQE